MQLSAIPKQFRNNFISAVFSQTVMDRKLLLERGERTVERVGGIWNVEVRIFLIDEEVRQVCFQ